jgi:hypothetical protein
MEHIELTKFVFWAAQCVISVCAHCAGNLGCHEDTTKKSFTNVLGLVIANATGQKIVGQARVSTRPDWAWPNKKERKKKRERERKKEKERERERERERSVFFILPRIFILSIIGAEAKMAKLHNSVNRTADCKLWDFSFARMKNCSSNFAATFDPPHVN